ncbi:MULTISPECIES: HEPN family nuclease [Giesbergeria]|uniref:HEPN family nuclease n=1 Tax=Giesbergeria sinuosa TaxID=80883 RepID=A0ABV9QHE0_9BURK
MEYEENFEKSFMRRTLSLISEYEGSLDATLLVNCLLGLLVLPKETFIAQLPDVDFESLADWGVEPTSIREVGRCSDGHQHNPTLKQLIRRLRNAVAHFRVKPIHRDEQVHGFTFRDQNGFHAKLSLTEMKTLVVKLATHLEAQA